MGFLPSTLGGIVRGGTSEASVSGRARIWRQNTYLATGYAYNGRMRIWRQDTYLATGYASGGRIIPWRRDSRGARNGRDAASGGGDWERRLGARRKAGSRACRGRSGSQRCGPSPPARRKRAPEKNCTGSVQRALRFSVVQTPPAGRKAVPENKAWRMGHRTYGTSNAWDIDHRMMSGIGQRALQQRTLQQEEELQP